MAKTNAERAAEYRKRIKESGDSERLNVIAGSDVIKILRLYADYHEITQADALRMIVSTFWSGVDKDEKEKIADHARSLEKRKKVISPGDTHTRDMFS